MAALEERDRHLAHELAAGVLRHRSELDARLAPLITRGWEGVPGPLRDVLRLGAYQLTHLERVPVHAAVNTAVDLAHETGGARAAGFVNAVLRRLGPGRPEPAADRPLWERLSHPRWLVERWIERYGEPETTTLLQWNNGHPPLVVQPARAGREALERLWSAEGIEFHPAPADAGLVVEGGRPDQLPGYAEGLFFVQDPAQALVVRFAGLPAGALLYDAAAAPGGKTLALSRDGAQVAAADRTRARVASLRRNLARAGTGREWPLVADAVSPPIRPVDAVLLDAPCLGTGTFARHPDARWRVTPGSLRHLAARQGVLLEALAERVRPGGLLLYATCSLEPEENEWQIETFLSRHPEFRREPGGTMPPGLLSPEGDLRILPQRDHMDGAFASRLKKTADRA